MKNLPSRFLKFQTEYSEFWLAYEGLGQVAAQSGPLDQKTRELVKMGMAAGMRARSSVKSHAHRALDAGAAPKEIEHAIMIGVTTMGFPNMMTALSWVKDAIANHEFED